MFDEPYTCKLLHLAWSYRFDMMSFPLFSIFPAQCSKCGTEPPSCDFKTWTCWIFFRQEPTTICLVAVIVPLPWLGRCLQVLHQEGIGNLLFIKLSPHLKFARHLYSCCLNILSCNKMFPTIFPNNHQVQATDPFYCKRNSIFWYTPFPQTSLGSLKAG